MKKLIGPFQLSDIKLVVSQEKYTPPAVCESIIEKAWQELLKKTQEKVWNGQIYRLNQYEEVNGKINLSLGLLDYKVHWAAPFLKEILNDLPLFVCPNGLFASAYLKTSDSRFVFSQKSRSSILNHEFNLIGGNLNADEMKIQQTVDLWRSCLKEIREETGLAEDLIKLGAGVGVYLTDKFRVGIFWQASITLSSAEIIPKIKLNEEHHQLLFLTKEEFRRFLLDDNEKINPYIKETSSLIL